MTMHADNGDTIAIGDRVELHPATNAWMFGDQYGAVVKLGTSRVHVAMDRSGRTLKLAPESIGRVIR